jgi:hypothetical protein
MTITEFNDLWNRDFAGLPPLAGVPMPDYNDHRISERMLEDYLDIFRGYNTREGENIMPYPHPFFDATGNSLLGFTPCIKYILIGEARPPQIDPEFNDCGGDMANTYFYNKLHIGRIVTQNERQYNMPTPWLNEPRLKWGCPPFQPCPNNKVQTLLCLASNGVLLLDIFPFAIPYGPIRPLLNAGGITRFYWDNPTNPYSLSNRINENCDLLCDDWDLSLIAPCIISRHIIDPINAFPPIATIPVGLHPAQFRTLMPDATRCPLGVNWRKVAVSAAGAPTQNLINLSF